MSKVAFLVEHVEMAGSLPAALLLSRLVYAYGHGRKGRFMRNDSEWRAETGLTAKQVRRARQHLSDRGLVRTKIESFQGKKSVRYLLDWDRYVGGLRTILDRDGIASG